MIVVLASGSGSNFEALVARFGSRVAGLVCNVSGAGVVARAERWGVPVRVVPHAGYSSRKWHEEAVVNAIRELGVPRVVVLAGYMRIFSPLFFEYFHAYFPKTALINIHPAPLQSYKGPDGYGAAVAGRFPRWAISVHKVTPQLDSGPLLGERSFPVFPWESSTALHARARPLEHALLNDVIQNLLQKEPPT